MLHWIKRATILIGITLVNVDHFQAVAAAEPAGWLGIVCRSLTTEDRATKNTQSQDGAVVLSVDRQSPAWSGGLREGDVIVEFNGTKIRNVKQLTQVIAAQSPGASAAIGFFRGKTRSAAFVIFGQSPKASRPAATATSKDVRTEDRPLADKFLACSPQKGLRSSFRSRQMRNVYISTRGLLMWREQWVFDEADYYDVVALNMREISSIRRVSDNKIRFQCKGNKKCVQTFRHVYRDDEEDYITSNKHRSDLIRCVNDPERAFKQLIDLWMLTSSLKNR